MQYNGLRLTSKGYPCNNLAVYTSGHSLPSHLIILFSDISQLFIIHPFPRLHNSQLKDAVSPTLHTLYMVLFTSDTIMSEFKFVNAIDHHMYLVHYFNLCVEWIPVFLRVIFMCNVTIVESLLYIIILKKCRFHYRTQPNS